MTVADLIKELGKYPSHLRVIIWNTTDNRGGPIQQILAERATDTNEDFVSLIGKPASE